MIDLLSDSVVIDFLLVITVPCICSVKQVISDYMLSWCMLLCMHVLLSFVFKYWVDFISWREGILFCILRLESV
jgi:hypothetical protein